MADYAADISTSDYPYIKEITVTEMSGEDQSDFPIKISLNSTNFNFDLASGFVGGTRRVNYEEMTHWASSTFQGSPNYCSDGEYDGANYWRFQTHPGWWKVDLGSGNVQKITSVKFRLWSGAAGDPTQMLKDFRVSGSNNNSSWDTIYDGTAAQNADLQEFFFDAFTETYRYYKIDIFNNHGGSSTTLGAIDLIESFGDFHLTEKSNGTCVLNRWVTRWSDINNIADIWFKIPQLLANETKTLYAYWGNPTGSGISDIHSIGFFFSDHFDDNTTYNNNWSVGGNVYVYDYFNTSEVKLINHLNSAGYIQTKTNPIPPLSSWATEIGFWMYSDTIENTWIYSHRINFCGSGVPDFYCYFAEDGDGGSYLFEDEDYGVFAPRCENFQYAGATYPTNYYSHMWGALVPESYHRHFFAYYLPTETLYMGMYDRDVSKISEDCPDFWKGDYVETKERRIEGNSDSRALRIWGSMVGSFWAGTPINVDWVIIRKYLGPYEPELDLSNLYVPYEQIDPDAIDWYGYGSDITNFNFGHTTTSGGVPNRLSDNSYNSLANSWCSDDGAASDSNGVDVVIYLGLYGDDVTDDDYLHYDSGHILYNNASKLSNEDEDTNSNDYWLGTTTSGWACIDFGSIGINNVGALLVKGVSSNTSGMVKNYKVEGSYVYTNVWEDGNWQVLIEGQFEQTASWQAILFRNDFKYRFYRLKVIDTYGSNIALQEWKMLNHSTTTGKKIISKLKLKPADFDTQYIYFPKQIKFFGSNDLYNWDTLINTKNTYTPTSGNWQEYTFTNEKRYYFYKLKCIGNWNSNTGKICIPEWEMLEKTAEEYIYRILSGSTNDFNNIWVSESCTFDSGCFYVTNDNINVVEDDELARYEVITGDIRDVIVMEV